MKCPIDHTDLVMSERQGIEIDYCPTCRGVWLDRGELDKIIDRTDAEVSRTSAPTHHSPSAYASSRSEQSHDRNAVAHGGVAAMAAKVLHTLSDSSHKKHGSHGYRHYDDDDHYYGRKKKKSGLHDLFDF